MDMSNPVPVLHDRGVYNHLKQALRLPPDIAAKTEGMPIFEGGQRHILPSFFNLLLHLNEQVSDCAIVCFRMLMAGGRTTDCFEPLHGQCVCICRSIGFCHDC